jgi:starvation-inducible DNA-binding protein
MASSRTTTRPARTPSKTENRRRVARNESSVTSTRQSPTTVPGLETATATTLIEQLQQLLVGYIDTALTLKHIHWNVVGPSFIGVHQMLDPQVAGVSAMVDSVAERIATLGGSPNGLPGNLVAGRHWDDYELGRADVQAHLAALDLVYSGLISSARDLIDPMEDLDPVTQDLVIGQIAVLEQYQWFVRAHLEDAAGGMRHAGETTELGAAAKGARRARSTD